MRSGTGRRWRRTVGRLGAAALLTTVGIVVADAPAQATATRTVAFWSMDEPAGATVLKDSSGNGRNGTVGSEVVTGALYAGASGHRFAYHSPPDQEYVPGHVNLVPHSTDFNPDAGDFSFTIRYRTTHSFGNILQKGQGSTAGGYWKFEAPAGKPRCLFRGGDGSSRTGYTDVSIADGQWHTVTCNRTSTYVEMYVDGVRKSRLTGPTGTIANSWQFSIGGKSSCDGVKVTCDYFAGDIDYVKILKGAGGATNQPPVANLAPSCSGLVCTFSAAGSTDADGAIQDYRWDFGDGSTADTVSVPTTSHTYATAGTYPVTLTVTDDRGATGTVTVEVTVAPVAERISFVGQATANANLTTHSVVVPTSVQAGDALLLFFSQNTHATTSEPTGVTGWTKLDRLDGGNATTTAWWKVAAAGDAGATLRVTLGVQSKGNLVVAGYRGVDPAQPFSAFARATDPASAAARITPYATVTAAQSWGVSYWMHGDGLSTALAPPPGVEVRSNSSQSGGGRVTGLLADSASTVPTGSYGGLTATGAAASTTTTTWTLILRPV
ncbi:concanavalin A-like lectin/glucanase superfamily protein [Micromonospora kangleipakensis]|uniref:Concanavalin A-like lectin/glucanase superfamily protein n=1 Tax=Micromonospora kangleipakensis TaxID=1077942 RepID=A0A4Q8BAR5_9ACTN|nr:PKD domain-containing protein [Micromonospora kangleipakensis]RZU74295.1 concanavalin A-like lectin/glucanase superfamily protein [Micromonospora kangleipakensis]